MVSVVPLRRRQQLENAVFLAGQMQRLAVDLDRAAVEIDRQLAGADDRFGMALGAADDRLDARDQLAAVERLGQEVVGAEAEALDLVVELGEAGEDQDRRAHARGAQAAQHLIAVDIGQHEVEDDDVVIVELADLEPVFAEIGGIADEALGPQHQLDALRGGGIVFDQ